MERPPNQDEIDTLLEVEFRLQQDLNMVQRRLAQLLPKAVGETVVRHLAIVPDQPA